MRYLLALPLLLAFAGVSLANEQPTAPAHVLIYQGRIRDMRANPLFLDGVEVASLRHRWSYFVLTVPLGEHAFRGRRVDNELVLDVQPGQNYYLRLDQVLEAWDGHEKLTRTSAEEVR